MTRRWGLLLAVAFAVWVAPAAGAAPRTSPLVVSGLGGQSVVLSVGAAGLDVQYPVFAEQPLRGGDAGVGGVAIQGMGDSRLVGGVLLENAPGFSRAVTVPLVGFDHTVLRAGRYRLTLLGSGPQTVHLAARGTAPRHAVARGAAHPITRVNAGTSPVATVWSDPLGHLDRNDYVVTGAGSGGELQQGSEDDLCLESQATVAAPCLLGGGFTVTPGDGAAGTWSGYQYPPGTLAPGSYVFSGNAIGAGPSSTVAHAAVVISLPRWSRP
ncbi:MAG: hypothetical protein QOJ79_2110 [Actinomycetota bacterium]|jgi:hypothetical protein|nr:hypothetical protein [Actinomycetota bacterium]